jgi:hypothetical protein
LDARCCQDAEFRQHTCQPAPHVPAPFSSYGLRAELRCGLNTTAGARAVMWIVAQMRGEFSPQPAALHIAQLLAEFRPQLWNAAQPRAFQSAAVAAVQRSTAADFSHSCRHESAARSCEDVSQSEGFTASQLCGSALSPSREARFTAGKCASLL